MGDEHFLASLAGGQIGGEDGDFVMVEWTDAGESEWEWIASPHVHHADDEAWYVLEGILRFRIGDCEYEAGPGSAVLAPKGTPHACVARRERPRRNDRRVPGVALLLVV